MPPDAPSIGHAAAQAWNDTFSVLVGLPFVSFIALAICAALGIVQDMIVPDVTVIPDAKSALISVAAPLVQTVLLTPYFIAAHRFLILGEITTHYTFSPATNRFRRFAGWSVVLALLTSAPQFVALLPAWSAGARVLIALLAIIAAAIVLIRAILLFPSIAVDARGAAWGNAIADTKGYAWPIFLIDLLAVLPLLIVTVAAAFGLAFMGILADGPRPLSLAGVVSGVLLGAFVFLFATLAIVIASRLYERLGQRTKGAAA